MSQKKKAVPPTRKPKLRLFKLVIQPVFFEVDEKGEPVREVAADPVPAYSIAQADKWLKSLPGQIRKLNEAAE
jgi:hypothetical protein